jgi:hypothetical protein
MVTRVNGGTINSQTLTGSLRYFLLNAAQGEPGPFEATTAKIVNIRNEFHVINATVVNGGGSYVAPTDVLTVVGGSPGPAATLTVKIVDGGEVVGVSVTNAGSYDALPTNPVSVTGGTGTLATFNLEFTSGIIIPGATGATADGSEYFVSPDAPIPGSAADQIMQLLSQKATIVNVALIDASTNEIMVVCENTGFAWDTPAAGDAAAEMQAAIRALGAAVPVPDNTNTGGTADLTTLTVTEKFFNDGVT